MRAPLLFFSLLAFSYLPLHAKESASKESFSSPAAKEFHEHRSMNRYTPIKSEGIEYVVGNDLWQPQQHYKPGRDWLALVCDGKGCTLEVATLAVKQESWQGHYDDQATLGQHLNFTVTGRAANEVVAWFNTAKPKNWLNAGSVATYYSPQRPLKQPARRGTLEAMIELPQGETALLVPLLATKSYLRKSFQHDSDWPEAVLQLRADHKRQFLGGILNTCDGVFQPRDYLLWAGDIDRDDKPDYLITDATQSAGGVAYLYLSSLAGPDQLVGLGGTYNYPPFGGECDGPGGYLTYDEVHPDGK